MDMEGILELLGRVEVLGLRRRIRGERVLPSGNKGKILG